MRPPRANCLQQLRIWGQAPGRLQPNPLIAGHDLLQDNSRHQRLAFAAAASFTKKFQHKHEAKQNNRNARKQTKSTKDTEEPASGDSAAGGEEKEGPMQPSASLQSRLNALRRPPANLITAFEEETLAEQHASPDAGLSGRGAEGSNETIPMPQVKNKRVKTAEYVSSSVKLQQCPPPKYPEIAVVGRSNVGKSSLINMLTGRRELALVSKKPGKTQCINHFLINNSWYLVDLPGYGYAKAAKERRVEWGKFSQEYFQKRETLANVLLLVDASVPTQSIDLGCAQWLAEKKVPYSLVFTKADKRKKRCPSPEDNIRAFEAALVEMAGEAPVSLVTSSVGGVGKEILLNYLAQLRHVAIGT